MRRARSYSLSRRIGFVFGLTMFMALSVLGGLVFVQVSDRVLREEFANLESIACRFEHELSRMSSLIRDIEGDQRLSQVEKVAAVNDLVQPVVDTHAGAQADVGLGYYSKVLEAVVAVAPWSELEFSLGQALSPEHPSRALYACTPVQRLVGDVTRGRVAAFGRVIMFEGEPVGHIWANIPIQRYHGRLVRVLLVFLLLWILAVALTMVLLRWISQEIARSTAALERRLDSLGGELADGEPLETSFPEEFQPLFRQFSAVNQRVHVLSQELVELTRLAAFGELARTVVHDLKNPLAVISANAQLGLQSIQDPKRGKELLQRILGGTEEIDQFLRKTLQAAKPSQNEDSFIDVPALVDDVVRCWKPLCSTKGVDVRVHCAAELPRVIGDPMALQRALLNLLKNACDAMPGGGVITLRVSAVGREVQVSVSDTGHGIPVEDRPRIFSTFFTTKEQGTGIGLASVHSHITDQGGKIWFESTEGEGTTFYFTLPVRKPAVAARTA